jgi:hypothetical protein
MADEAAQSSARLTLSSDWVPPRRTGVPEAPLDPCLDCLESGLTGCIFPCFLVCQKVIKVLVRSKAFRLWVVGFSLKD